MLTADPWDYDPDAHGLRTGQIPSTERVRSHQEDVHVVSSLPSRKQPEVCALAARLKFLVVRRTHKAN